jgi:hypothetical protein
MAWPEITEEERAAPLGDYEGCDIFTRRTLEDIVNTNEQLEE